MKWWIPHLMIPFAIGSIGLVAGLIIFHLNRQPPEMKWDAIPVEEHKIITLPPAPADND
jgi:hypothetical protein